MKSRLLAGVVGMVVFAGLVAGCGDDDDGGGGDTGAGLATICVGEEFSTRPDGLPGLQEAYGFEIPRDQVSAIEDAVVYTQVASGDTCNFGSVFATDGQIESLDLRLLEDDQMFFASYNPALNVRQEVLDANPDIAGMFTPVAEALETEVIQGLNAAVDAEGEDPADVARGFLEENDLLAEAEGVDLAGVQLTVGGKEFTEQLILGQITIQLLEAAGAEVSDQTSLGGSTVAREALESGEIDMYWEYSGTAWLTYLGNDTPVEGAEAQYNQVKEADAANGIVWLDPAPFDNTYAIAVRNNAGGELDGLQTISDLAALVNDGGGE